MLTAQYLIELGTIQNARGEFAAALALFHEAAILQRQLGNRGREAEAIDGTGLVYQALGRYDEALDFHLTAAAVQRELADTWQLARALANACEVLLRLGDGDRVATFAGEALDLLASFEDPRASRLRARVSRMLPRRGQGG